MIFLLWFECLVTRQHSQLLFTPLLNGCAFGECHTEKVYVKINPTSNLKRLHHIFSCLHLARSACELREPSTDKSTSVDWCGVSLLEAWVLRVSSSTDLETLQGVQKQNKFNLQIFTCSTLPSQPETSLPCQQAH